MRKRLHDLRLEWAKIGRPPLRARTGINSGPMLVVNLGSRYRFAYGVIGDQVNLGSRLEGLNKIYGTDILIGENTARLVEKSFLLRKIDLVRVVGREQCVQIYELVAKSDAELPEELKEALNAYAAGYKAYCDRAWQEGIALFKKALMLQPEDGPSQTMAERCQIYQKSPPPEDWDGVYEPATK